MKEKQLTKNGNNPEKAREAALKLLDYSDRTESELTERLLKKGYEPDIVDEVVGALVNCGLVDDTRYAELFIKGKLEAGKGKIWIRNKLKEKGIDASTVEAAFDAALQEADESVLCLRKALSVCGLADMYEVDAGGEIGRALFYDGETFDDGELRYFYRDVADDESDRQEIYKAHEKAKARLVRRLVSLGYTSGMAFDAAKKIDLL